MRVGEDIGLKIKDERWKSEFEITDCVEGGVEQFVENSLRGIGTVGMLRGLVWDSLTFDIFGGINFDRGYP